MHKRYFFLVQFLKSNKKSALKIKVNRIANILFDLIWFSAYSIGSQINLGFFDKEMLDYFRNFVIFLWECSKLEKIARGKSMGVWPTSWFHCANLLTKTFWIKSASINWRNQLQQGWTKWKRLQFFFRKYGNKTKCSMKRPTRGFAAGRRNFHRNSISYSSICSLNAIKLCKKAKKNIICGINWVICTNLNIIVGFFSCEKLT